MRNNDEPSEEENPSNDEVHFRDENVPSKASKDNTTSSHKRPRTGKIYDMFDVKGKQGVELAIARFLLTCAIPFNVSRSSYF